MTRSPVWNEAEAKLRASEPFRPAVRAPPGDRAGLDRLGRADRPLDLDYTFAAEVGRLGRFLDQLALGPCNLFVHDYGGLIGLGLMVRQPERALRFAILNSRAHRTFPPLYLAGRPPRASSPASPCSGT